MRNWMDLNRDGEIDRAEEMFAEEMLCGSREEHIALFGYSGDFEDDEDEEELWDDESDSEEYELD